jgi:hypothetical protein
MAAVAGCGDTSTPAPAYGPAPVNEAGSDSGGAVDAGAAHDAPSSDADSKD